MTISPLLRTCPIKIDTSLTIVYAHGLKQTIICYQNGYEPTAKSTSKGWIDGVNRSTHFLTSVRYFQPGTHGTCHIMLLQKGQYL